MTWSSVIMVSGVVSFLPPLEGNEVLIRRFAFLPVLLLLVPAYLIVRYSRTLKEG